MKKILLFSICLVVIAGCFACQSQPENSVVQTTSIITTPTPTPNISGVLPQQEVKIFDINLDGNNETAEARSKGLISTMLSYAPDSIGVQEARGNWNTILAETLGETYHRKGTAADGLSTSETALSSYVYYNKHKYNAIDSGTFWLSKTPYTPSIYGSTVDCNRTCVWVILEHKYTKFRYVHMSTHLDWMDKEATRYQISLIRDQIKLFEKMGLPVFCGGDFNTGENTTAYNEMFKSGGIANAKYVAEKTMNLGTYPSYGKNDVTKSSPIDHVFVTDNTMDVIEYKVVDDKPDGQYFSDHNGLFIHARVHSMPDSYMYATAPDISALKFNIESSAENISISFEQPKHSVAYDTFRICIKDTAGSTVFLKEFSARYLGETPVTFDTENKLSSGTTYSAEVTATNTFKLKSTSKFEFTIPKD